MSGRSAPYSASTTQYGADVVRVREADPDVVVARELAES